MIVQHVDPTPAREPSHAAGQDTLEGEAVRRGAAKLPASWERLHGVKAEGFSGPEAPCGIMNGFLRDHVERLCACGYHVLPVGGIEGTAALRHSLLREKGQGGARLRIEVLSTWIRLRERFHT